MNKTIAFCLAERSAINVLIIHPSVIRLKCCNLIDAISCLNCTPSAINEKLQGPGNEIDNNFKNCSLFCNGTFSLFQRLVVHAENIQNRNVRCQVMGQDLFKDMCEYMAFLSWKYNKWASTSLLCVIFENCAKLHSPIQWIVQQHCQHDRTGLVK